MWLKSAVVKFQLLPQPGDVFIFMIMYIIAGYRMDQDAQPLVVFLQKVFQIGNFIFRRQYQVAAKRVRADRLVMNFTKPEIRKILCDKLTQLHGCGFNCFVKVNMYMPHGVVPCFDHYLIMRIILIDNREIVKRATGVGAFAGFY
jgi:hypothetical protein